MGLNIQESISMAARSLNANKMRSSLTMLGMIIGNAAVIAIVSVGLGTQRYINQEFESLGTHLLFVIPGIEHGPGAAPMAANTLVLADAEAIEQEITAVAAVAPTKSQHLLVSSGSENTQVKITGTWPEYLTVRSAAVAEGPFIGPLDLVKRNRVAVLGSATAEDLFASQTPIGEKIRIRDRSFTVIGVMAEKGAVMGRNQDEVIFIPMTVMTAQLAGRDSIRSSPSVDSISVSARDAASASAAQYQITNLLRLRHNIVRGDNDFSIRNQQDLLESATNITNILVLVLGATAGISLLVGGIGIMNIMLVSVSERTQEIGLRKAVGATQRDILAQFTIEAVILSIAGGLLGIALGSGTVVLIGVFSPLDAILSPLSILLAASVSGAIGVGFGIYPARSAAQRNPIVALRGA